MVSVRRLVVVLALLGGCSVRAGCASSTVQRSVEGMEIEITARGQREFGVGGAGIPHVGGLLWPEFDGFGVELQVAVDGRPPFSLAHAAEDPEVKPDEAELERAAEALTFDASEDGEHLAFRRQDSDRWTVVHLLPAGQPFSLGKEPIPETADGDPDFSGLESAESLALGALRRSPGPDVLAAIRDQPAAQPWDDALLERWLNKDARKVLVERLEKRSNTDGDFVQRVAALALPGIGNRPDRTRAAVDLLLALGDEATIERMDEALLDAVEHDHARNLLGRRIARIPTLGRDHRPSESFKERARAALETRDRR